MSASPAQIIRLEDIRFVTLGTLLTLDIDALRELENQADKAVYDAGTRLEWIRGVIKKKLHDAGVANASGA